MSPSTSAYSACSAGNAGFDGGLTRYVLHTQFSSSWLLRDGVVKAAIKRRGVGVVKLDKTVRVG
jgi:hypothetical protein